MNLYTKNIVEFVTVGVEYCAFMEHSDEKQSQVFIEVMQKLLPLLYMKTAMLEKPIPVGDDNIQVFVTESDYEAIKQSVSRLVAANDAYYDGESAASISENLTDIYQDIKNFTLNYKEGNQAVSNDALYSCIENFETYWGKQLLNALKHIHEIRYNPQNDENDDNNISIDNY